MKKNKTTILWDDLVTRAKGRPPVPAPDMSTTKKTQHTKNLQDMAASTTNATPSLATTTVDFIRDDEWDAEEIDSIDPARLSYSSSSSSSSSSSEDEMVIDEDSDNVRASNSHTAFPPPAKRRKLSSSDDSNKGKSTIPGTICASLNASR